MKYSILLTGLLAFGLFTAKAQTPTLQSVTDNGNTTNNFIKINGQNKLQSIDGLELFYDNNGEAIIQNFKRGSTLTYAPMWLGATVLKTNGRMLINNAVDDSNVGLRVNGDVRLSYRGQSYIVNNYVTLGETVSGAATVLGNNAMADRSTSERINFGVTTLDGSNAIVMSNNLGTMFHVKPATTGARAAGDKWFSVGDGTDEVMRLTPNRNMLINTTTDDVNYKLQVNGDVKARKIKVTQTGWADFVFEPDYRMPSLQELERYVKEHKHLPGIPSAGEVAEQGIDLGEMNKKLLQKVEEQMLYIIQQQKEIEGLKKDMKDLKTKLKK